MSNTSRLRTGLIAASLTFSFGSAARAVNIAWSGTTGLWTDGANWTGGVAPGAADVGQIGNGGTVSFDSTMNITSAGIQLGHLASTSGNMVMTGGTISSSSDIRIGGSGTNGTGVFTMSGGSIVLTGGNWNIGFGANATTTTASGTFNLNGGSVLVQTGGIIAVGNRGAGTVNQTAGSFFTLGATPATAVINIGRNNATVQASGTYNLSGGSLTGANLQFGNGVTTGAGSVNTFTLSGTGMLVTSNIVISNTNAVNSFNFNGGTLLTENVGINLTNNGGNLMPTDLNFSAATTGGVPMDQTGVLTFGANNSYAQNSGTLTIDIDGPGSNDLLDIGAAASLGNATIGGTIAVNLLSGYDPAPGVFFDIVTADAITSTASITGQTASGFTFQQSEIIGGDGREVLRLTVVPEPSGAVMAGLAGLALSWRRGRRKSH